MRKVSRAVRGSKGGALGAILLIWLRGGTTRRRGRVIFARSVSGRALRTHRPFFVLELDALSAQPGGSLERDSVNAREGRQ
eukprot:10293924-Alexandrium_andersonii.AAC.1